MSASTTMKLFILCSLLLVTLAAAYRHNCKFLSVSVNFFSVGGRNGRFNSDERGGFENNFDRRGGMDYGRGGFDDRRGGFNGGRGGFFDRDTDFGGRRGHGGVNRDFGGRFDRFGR